MMRINRFLQWGILLLILTTFLVTARARWIHQDEQANREQQSLLRDVVMAQHIIPERTLITPAMVRVQTVDTGKQPVPLDAPRSLADVLDKISAVQILPGQAITAGQVLAKEKLGLAGQLPLGKRAITIAVSDITAVAGLLRTGDRVDVLGTYSGSQNGGIAMTKTLLQGVPVAAVGKSLDQQQLSSAQPNNLVTLAVSPREARILALAQTRASIQLVLQPLAEEDEVASVPAVSIERSAPRPKKAVIKHTPRRQQPVRRQQPEASMFLAPPRLPLTEPALIEPLTPPAPPRPQAERGVGSGPAPTPVTATPHTVEVIRGTQRETVTLRTMESKVMTHEPAQDPQ